MLPVGTRIRILICFHNDALERYRIPHRYADRFALQGILLLFLIAAAPRCILTINIKCRHPLITYMIGLQKLDLNRNGQRIRPSLLCLFSAANLLLALCQQSLTVAVIAQYIQNCPCFLIVFHVHERNCSVIKFLSMILLRPSPQRKG